MSDKDSSILEELIAKLDAVAKAEPEESTIKELLERAFEKLLEEEG